MKVTKESIEIVHSCNFCKRSTLGADHKSLLYPYTHVYVIEGNNGGISARICEQCYGELTGQVKEIEEDLLLKEASVGKPSEQEFRAHYDCAFYNYQWQKPYQEALEKWTQNQLKNNE